MDTDDLIGFPLMDDWIAEDEEENEENGDECEDEEF